MTQQPAADVLVTTDSDAFVRALKPGDILLFDTLIWVSNLIQFADNAPANHCAVVLTGDRLVDAGRSTTNHPRPTTVWTFDLRDYLAHSPRTRAVQAMRMTGLDPSVGAALDQALLTFTKATYTFAEMDLFWLAPAAMRRSYEQNLKDGGESRPGMTDDALRILHSALMLACKLTGGRVGKDQYGLTCSEFVYLLLNLSGVAPEITSPLLAPLAQLSDGSPWPADELAAEQRLLDERRAHNAALDSGLAARSLDVSGVQADRVTPGDFYRSPSLRPAAMLVMPGPPAS